MSSVKESEIELKSDNNVMEEVDNDSSDDESVDLDYGDEEDNTSLISQPIESDESNNDVDSSEQIVKKEDRITRPFLTKYEYVRIIGTRRKQLSLGAKPMVKVDGKLTINEIVDEEIRNNMVPLKIKRPLPDSNKVEIWSFDELEKSHLLG